MRDGDKARCVKAQTVTMGQQRTTTQRLLNQHPICCFCGGTVAAETLDHQPPKILFPNKHRPKGMEFPACVLCNGQTRGDEALVSLIARFTGEARFPKGSNDPALDRVFRAAMTAFPSLFPDVVRPVKRIVNGVLTGGLAFDLYQPTIMSSLCRFAAKLALATYYDHFKSIAPSRTRINTYADHNQNTERANAVQTIISMMPRDRYLAQGAKWDTQDTFFLRYHVEGAAFVMAAVLHQSIVLNVALADEQEPDQADDWAYVWRPVPGQGIQPFLKT